MAFNYSDPDKSAQGFLGFTPNPMRYEFYDPSCYGVHNTIASLIPPESSVLEIGCGTAILGDVLKKKGIRLYEGVEPSQERARASKAKGHLVHNVYLCDETVEMLDTYDVVVLADVIEHLENPRTILDYSKLLMHNDSKLILSVPNVAHWSIRLRLLTGRFNYTETGILDATHLRWFTRTSLKRYLEHCGFKIVQCRYTSGYTLSAYASLIRISSFFMSQKNQQKILAKIVERWPNMFACQIVFMCHA